MIDKYDKMTQEIQKKINDYVIRNTKKNVRNVLNQIIVLMEQTAGCEDCNHHNLVKCRGCTWDDAITIVKDILEVYENDCKNEEDKSS